MVSSLIMAIVFFVFTPLGAREYEGVRLLAIVTLSTVIWVAVTFLTSPTSTDNLKRFYEHVRPGGFGWRRIENEFGLSSSHTGLRDLGGVVSGAVFIYSSLFATGRLVLGFPLSVWLPLALIALASGAVMFYCLREEKPGTADKNRESTDFAD